MISGETNVETMYIKYKKKSITIILELNKNAIT